MAEKCSVETEYLVLPTALSDGRAIIAVAEAAYMSDNTLKALIVPDGITILDSFSFYNCKNLQSVYISKDVKIISENSFTECTSLSAVTVDVQNTEYYSKDNCIIEKTNNEMFSYGIYHTAGRVVLGCGDSIPDEVKVIGANSFSYNQSEYIAIPKGVTEIQFSGFSYSKLKSITLPEGVRIIGDRAFAGCADLTEVYIPISVTDIGKNAFDTGSGITIYCETAEKPDGWSENWLGENDNCTVIWNYRAR